MNRLTLYRRKWLKTARPFCMEFTLLFVIKLLLQLLFSKKWYNTIRLGNNNNKITFLFTRLIAIKIAPLTDLFLVTVRCFVNSRLLICNFPLLKYISFNAKCFFFAWLTSNHMSGLGNSWDKSPLWFSKCSKMHSGNLFEIALPSMWLLVQVKRKTISIKNTVKLTQQKKIKT